MNKVNYSLVVVSNALQSIVSAWLQQNDILYSIPLTEEKKFLNRYVKENTVELNNYDSIIIELAALSDSNAEIMETLENIRFLDDSMRIIIISENRLERFELLNHCFLNGIYNLVCGGSYVEIKNQLLGCLKEGMSYKDALIYRDMETFKKTLNGNEKNTVEVKKRRNITFAGVKHRIGVTHCTLAGAYTLTKKGYLVALVDCTKSTDYQSIVQSYGLKLTEKGCYTLDDIDIYISSEERAESLSFEAYNYVLYDMGLFNHVMPQAETDMKILLCGSKSWELPDLSLGVKSILESRQECCYLFNFTAPEMQRELQKMMKEAGLEKSVYIMEYLPDPFTESEVLSGILGAKQITRKSFFKIRKK